MDVPDTTMSVEAKNEVVVESASAEGLVLDRINDIIDFETSHIINERENRTEHFESLEFFWKLHPANDVACGRLHARHTISELLVVACGGHPYGEGEQAIENHAEPAGPLVCPLFKMSRDSWDQLKTQFCSLREVLMRKDATLNYSSQKDVLMDAHEIDERRISADVFTRRYARMNQLIEINKAIAPIRPLLEDHLASNMPLRMNRQVRGKFEEVLVYVEQLGDEQVQGAVRSLFVEKDDSSRSRASAGGTTANSIMLIERDLLNDILRDKPFDLVDFQSRFEFQLLSMAHDVFKDDDGVLMKLRYTIEKDSQLDELLRSPFKNRKFTRTQQEAKVEDLRRSRTALRNNHGEDPLDESMEVAKEVTGQTSRKRRASEGRPSQEATPSNENVLPIVAGLDQDDEEMERERAKLSAVPKKPRIRTPGKDSDVPQPDTGIFDEKGHVLRRHRWTQEEKACVKEGVRQFGVGRWAEIKKCYGQMLRNRTSVQIKDCWRTMSKNGEVTVGVEEQANDVQAV